MQLTARSIHRALLALFLVVVAIPVALAAPKRGKPKPAPKVTVDAGALDSGVLDTDIELDVDAGAAAAEATDASARADVEPSAASVPAPPPASTGEYVRTASLELAAYTDSDHVSVFTPSLTVGIHDPIGGTTLAAHYLVDVVSAASVDIVSTASRRWSEVRHAGGLDLGYKPGDFGGSFAGSISSEPDYLSVSAGGELTYDIDEKNFTVLLGYNLAHDTIGRSGTPFNVFSRTLDKHTVKGGLSIVLNRATVLALGADVMFENGDQSKPYRYIPLFSPSVAPNVPLGASVDQVTAMRLPERPLEQLPLVRRRFAFTERFAHRFDGSTLRLEERVYYDTWALRASTTDTRWVVDLGRRVSIWPHVRFHVQSATSFWQRAYVSSSSTGWSLPEFRTGDRELGPLWTGTGGGGARFYIGPDALPHAWAIGLQLDGMYTSYLNDLYVTTRTGILGSMTIEAEL